MDFRQKISGNLWIRGTKVFLSEIQTESQSKSHFGNWMPLMFLKRIILILQTILWEKHFLWKTISSSNLKKTIRLIRFLHLSLHSLIGIQTKSHLILYFCVMFGSDLRYKSIGVAILCPSSWHKVRSLQKQMSNKFSK